MLSRYYAGRAPCNHCGYCANYGCEIGAKSSVLAALIPGALASGNCTLVPGAMVTDVTTDASGKATGVRYLDAQGAQHQKVRVERPGVLRLVGEGLVELLVDAQLRPGVAEAAEGLELGGRGGVGGTR